MENTTTEYYAKKVEYFCKAGHAFAEAIARCHGGKVKAWTDNPDGFFLDIRVPEIDGVDYVEGLGTRVMAIHGQVKPDNTYEIRFDFVAMIIAGHKIVTNLYYTLIAALANYLGGIGQKVGPDGCALVTGDLEDIIPAVVDMFLAVVDMFLVGLV